ncbi:MAG: DNA (cytosine-5-)-methyltransferase [Methylotenera sp.]|nr:DNA (cytosine-5-)-methyltransferase [Methylotenera sp.]
MNELKIGELFCGPGGMALGAELANRDVSNDTIKKLKHAWAVDYHEATVETYLKNIQGATESSAICADVRELNILDLKNISEIDGFAYGFPCNDFSLVGEQKGFDGEFGPLYKYGIKVLEIFNPSFFIAENVSGIRGAGEGKSLSKILDDLSKAGSGYVITPHMYKFEEYGIPQSRHRVILVGFRKDLKLKFNPPAPTHIENFTSSFDAITKPTIEDDAFNNELTKQHPRVVERLKHIKPGENAWTANLPENLKLNVVGAKISQIYKRLDPTKPSYTVTGSGGGGTHVYHWSENRALTNRERARLQTFPDNFIFHGNKESVRRQIGMAVPPLAAKLLFEAIVKTLEGRDYEHVEPNLSKYMAS